MRIDSFRLKRPEEVERMRAAGRILGACLAHLAATVRPGLTTLDLDHAAETFIRDHGCIPGFLGFEGFPNSLCVSVNDEVVHGIPGPRVLRAGDLVSVDCGAIVNGWHGDAAFSAIVPGKPDPAAGADPDRDAELVEVTRQAMWHGIAAIAAGERLNAVGAAVEDLVADRYGLVEDYGGHGIGTEMHQDPHVLNYRTRDRGPRMRPGLCLAVEPMLTLGDPETKVLADGWTVVTVDGGRAAHWEHSVALLEGGIWVLTARDGGVQELGALGVPVRALAG